MLPFTFARSPFVIHLKPAITQLAKEYQARGVRVVAISSNSTETHPQDGPELMAQGQPACLLTEAAWTGRQPATPPSMPHLPLLWLVARPLSPAAPCPLPPHGDVTLKPLPWRGVPYLDCQRCC